MQHRNPKKRRLRGTGLPFVDRSPFSREPPGMRWNWRGKSNFIRFFARSSLRRAPWPERAGDSILEKTNA
jgi:hypothetical protein